MNTVHNSNGALYRLARLCLRKCVTLASKLRPLSHRVYPRLRRLVHSTSLLEQTAAIRHRFNHVMKELQQSARQKLFRRLFSGEPFASTPRGETVFFGLSSDCIRFCVLPVV